MDMGRSSGRGDRGKTPQAPAVPNAALDEVALQNLEASLFKDSRADRLAVIDAMQISGISDQSIVDLYIPEVARRLGAQWCSDARSFVDVAVGTAHLQSLLHDIAVDWAADSSAGDPNVPTVLIAVREDIHHTLGALVVATQFRRLGATVRLALDMSDEEIVAEAKFGAYDMIALSASAGEAIGSINQLIASIREVASHSLHIALGGSILTVIKGTGGLRGIDYIGDAPATALRMCEQKRLGAAPATASKKAAPHMATAP